MNVYRDQLKELLDQADLLLATIKAVSKDDPFSTIRADYRATIADQMTQYLASDARSTAYKSAYKKSVNESFPAAFYRGYQDAGGDAEEVDAGADDWLTARTAAELGFVDEMFTALKSLRDQFVHGEVDAQDLRDEVANRTDGYTATLESVYSAGKMWAAKNQMLTWHLGATKEHCTDCARLDGQAHRAKWYLAHDFIPGKPGAALECGGYLCKCSLEDGQGNRVTL